ncbi:MAG: DNA helicase RecQ [Streptococcaceae bacterium]|jgi:ATP-dependent DNA helicase RecQ|nr:DNA helicase RecQ [Streptococcaceae bacterium]
MNLEKQLKENFGFDSFREGQKQIIEQVLAGQDTLAILPTGAGKSICYQLPALLLDGITVVISPLISLMKDQVDQLEAAGVAATFLNSTVDAEEVWSRMQDVAAGRTKLLFVAPERFDLASFNDFIYQLPIKLIAIDEAHCISQWGHDFRPSYLAFAERLENLPQKPTVLALTATATERVAADIEQLLNIPKGNAVKTGFLRENLHFEVVKNADKRPWLRNYLKSREESDTGIIYCSTRKEVEELADWLNHHNFTARRYHAGLSEAERAQNQEDFLYDNCQIMVVTNAFGMGINKSNVRYVIHYSTPADIESYYQEAGRAGRDGLESDAILLWALNDLRIRNFLIEQSEGDEAHKEQAYEKLRQMQAYANTETCLQRFILRYFGDEGKDCGKCSNCTDNRVLTDISIEAQKVMSCVIRMGERFGKTAVAGVLAGSTNKNLANWHFEKLSTYGIMKGMSQKAIGSLIDFLTSEGFLNVTAGKYPLLSVSNAGKRVLKGEVKVERRETMVRAKPKLDVPDDFNMDLFETLRKLRLEIARLVKLPPFMIFSDASLQDMTHLMPTSEEEFLEVSGVGPQKLEKYGAQFLKAITAFKDGQ